MLLSNEQKRFTVSKITIQIAYALPEKHFLQSYQVEQGTTLKEAIDSSELLTLFPDLDLNKSKFGIYSRPAKSDQILEAGDRIEIYRSLVADPKEIRRKRAEQQKNTAK